MSSPEFYAAVEADPHFREHVRRKAQVLWSLFGLFFLAYLGLLLGAAWYKPWFATRVIGEINLGTICAISQYFLAGALAWYYAVLMRKIDQRMQEILAAHPNPKAAKAAQAVGGRV